MQDQAQHGQLFVHQDGGYYRYLGMVRHADDQELHVLYEHLWPFDASLPWVRRASEWDGRFVRTTPEQLQEAMKQDRTAAQEAVTSAKAARRAARQAAQSQ